MSLYTLYKKNHLHFFTYEKLCMKLQQNYIKTCGINPKLGLLAGSAPMKHLVTLLQLTLENNNITSHLLRFNQHHASLGFGHQSPPSFNRLPFTNNYRMKSTRINHSHENPRSSLNSFCRSACHVRQAHKFSVLIILNLAKVQNAFEILWYLGYITLAIYLNANSKR